MVLLRGLQAVVRGRIARLAARTGTRWDDHLVHVVGSTRLLFWLVIGAWIGALRAWEALDVGAVCPGHGPVIDRAELGAIRQWFEGAVAAMAVAKQGAATFEEVLANPGLPAGYWPADATVPRWWGFCIKRLYDAS